MAFLETKIKELGRSALNNTHNTRSLIRTLTYVPGTVANGRSLYGERVYKHTHIPPPAYTQIYTHTQIESKSRSKSVCGFSIILILKGVMTF